ncbi:MAG: response regulator [Verrucomicrobiales bacterium]|nr:response regulator [Verrucomicrobiales bacterium]
MISKDRQPIRCAVAPDPPRGTSTGGRPSTPGTSRLLLLAFALALGLATTLHVPAKPVPVPFSNEYLSVVRGLEDGMPDNSCSGIVPGPDGSLWLGTFRGLGRYNGSGVSRYAPAGKPELARVGVVNLHREANGRLWLSTFSGLMSLHQGRWRVWSENDGWQRTGGHVRTYADRPGLDPVFTRFDGQVYRLEHDRFQELPQPPGPVGGGWAALDGEGGVYVVRGGSAAFWRDNRWQPLELPPSLEDGLTGAGQSRDGTALIFGRQTVLRYRGGNLVRRLDLSQPITQFWQALEDSTGSLWLPSVTAGAYRIRLDGTVLWLRKTQGLAHDGPTRTVFEDEDGGIWIGSEVGGMAHLRPPRFRQLGEFEGLQEAMVPSLFPTDAGHVFLGIYGSGPQVFDGTAVRPVLHGREAEVTRRIRTLLRTRDDSLWMGIADGGLRRWDGHTLHWTGTNVFAPDDTVSALFEDSRGRLWVGGERRVGLLESGTMRNLNLPDPGLGGESVCFAESGQQVFLSHRNTVRRYTPSGQMEELVRLPENSEITSLAVDPAGRLWAGSNSQGLFAFDGRELRQLGRVDGLPSETVGSLAMDGLGHLWFSCARQAVMAEPDLLWRAAGPESARLSARFFGESDGLRGLEFSSGSQPTVVKDPAGRLWFALARGAAMVDPGQLRFVDRPPRVAIESLRYVPHGGRLPVEALSGGRREPVLPAGIRQVEIRYTAFDFTSPDRHRFRVRLGEDPAAWQDVGNDRSVVFFEMPPGRHRVQVIAAGSDGTWNLEGTELGFVVSPYLWQTLWFRTSAALVVLAGAGATGWLASTRRLRQLKVQDALRRMATSLTEGLNPRTLGQRVAETSRALFHHDSFFLVLVDRAGAVKLCAYFEDTDLDQATPVEMTEGIRSLSAPLARVLDGEPLLINRAQGGQDPTLKTLVAQGFRHRRTASLMFAPIRWEDQTVGVISVQSYSENRYHASDLHQLETLAAHCGAAIARMEAEEHRRENEERLRLAMETVRMGTWEIDLARSTLVASPEAEAVYGYPPGTMSGNQDQLWTRASAADAAALQLQLQTVHDGNSAGLDAVHRIEVDGVERWLEVRARVHGSRSTGSSPRLVGVTADITARRQAERSRERLEEQLRQSQKQEAIGTLAGGIAHDFNNLLAVILGNVEAARHETSDSHPARASLAEIERSGLRARDLVRRILAFSRPQEQQRIPLHLGSVVEEVARLLRSTLPAAVEIHTGIDAETPWVLADASQIHQVLLNLGTNAWHALEGRGGCLRLNLKPALLDAAAVESLPALAPGRYALLEVQDDGHGMSAEIITRIFDPFFTTKPPGQGTGLGLAVAQAIVKSHQGAIAVDSQIGRGTTFRVYLPQTQIATPPPPPPAAPSTIPPSRTGARILFVDDEEGLVRLGRRILERAGYQVEAHSHAHRALELFRAAPDTFDAVVTDLSMPGISGLELAREILRLRPHLPIILTSGNLSLPESAEARALGIREVLAKPYSAAELLPQLTALVSNVQPDRPRA